MYVSFIIPAYNEEKNIEELYRRLKNSIQKIGIADHEIIFIDDGSKDNSYNILKGLSLKDKNIKIVKFSRNFGQHLAIMAGIEYCNGDAALIMDADLQDNPDLISKLFDKYNEGFDVIYAMRVKRKEFILKRLLFSLFHYIMGKIANVPIHKNAGILSIINRRVLMEIRKMGEYKPYIPGLRAYAGFKAAGVEIERNARHADKGKSFSELLCLAKDTIFSHSFFPLKMISFLWILNVIAAVILGGYILYKRLFLGTDDKFTLLIFVVVFLSSILMFSFVVIGEYIAVIFEESKKRPRYVIEEKINL